MNDFLFVTSYCYYSVNVITFGLFTSDHIKRLLNGFYCTYFFASHCFSILPQVYSNRSRIFHVLSLTRTFSFLSYSIFSSISLSHKHTHTHTHTLHFLSHTHTSLSVPHTHFLFSFTISLYTLNHKHTQTHTRFLSLCVNVLLQVFSFLKKYFY